jgi:hypothetical protein
MVPGHDDEAPRGGCGHRLSFKFLGCNSVRHVTPTALGRSSTVAVNHSRNPLPCKPIVSGQVFREPLNITKRTHIIQRAISV